MVPKPPEKICEFLEVGKPASPVPALAGHESVTAPSRRRSQRWPREGDGSEAAQFCYTRSADGEARGLGQPERLGQQMSITITGQFRA